MSSPHIIPAVKYRWVFARISSIGGLNMISDKKERMIELRRQGYSCSKIAEMLSVSINTVKSYCRRNKLQTSSTKEIHFCKQCGTTISIKDKYRPRLFCSDKCRVQWWKEHNHRVYPKPVYHLVCRNCGADFSSVGNRRQKYCSHACFISARFGKERDGDV